MDRVEQYRQIIKRVIQEYADFLPGYDGVKTEIVFDDVHGHYFLYYAGWNGRRRIHGNSIHIDIEGDKVIVQHDGTKNGIVDELIAAGITTDKIVLGFHHPDMRKHTEFAVA